MKKSLPNQFLIAGITFGLIFASVMWLTHSTAQPSANDSNAVSVTTTTAQNLSISKTISFSGPIVGRMEIPVYAELAQGKISSVLAEEGQQVKAGQILATVGTDLLEIQKSGLKAKKQKANAAVSQQEALLEEAEVQFKEAQSLRQRGADVAKSGYISNEIAEQRIFAEQTAAARVKAARNALEMALAEYDSVIAELAESQLYINKSSIRASVSGTIIERKVTVGQTLAQMTTPLFVMLNNDALEVELEIPSSDISRLQPGVPAKIQIIGDTTSYTGEIRLAAARINRNNQMGKLRVRFSHTPKAIPGQFAHVSVTLKPKTAIYVPDKAIRLENGLASVFTVKDGVAIQIPITLGERSGDMVEVLQGLSADMPIIDSFAAFMRAGEKVRVANPKPLPATKNQTLPASAVKK